MEQMRLGPVESRFADMIWRSEPVTTSALVAEAEEALSWKRTTTYTILKRLCQRGMFQNQGGTVTSLVSREEFYARQSEKFVEETFQGSLPAFLTAFGYRKRLSAEEIAALETLVEKMRGCRE